MSEKPKESEEVEVKNQFFGEVQATVYKLHPNSMYLLESLGKATLPDGRAVTLSTILSDGSLYLNVGEGMNERYIVPMPILIQAVLTLIVAQSPKPDAIVEEPEQEGG